MVPLVAPPETPPNEVHDAPLTMLRPIVDALGATLLPTDEATADALEEDVAEALGVSRFTVYNYLERAETD